MLDVEGELSADRGAPAGLTLARVSISQCDASICLNFFAHPDSSSPSRLVASTGAEAQVTIGLGDNGRGLLSTKDLTSDDPLNGTKRSSLMIHGMYILPMGVACLRAYFLS